MPAADTQQPRLKNKHDLSCAVSGTTGGTHAPREWSWSNSEAGSIFRKQVATARCGEKTKRRRERARREREKKKQTKIVCPEVRSLLKDPFRNHDPRAEQRGRDPQHKQLALFPRQQPVVYVLSAKPLRAHPLAARSPPASAPQPQIWFPGLGQPSRRSRLPPAKPLHPRCFLPPYSLAPTWLSAASPRWLLACSHIEHRGASRRQF